MTQRRRGKTGAPTSSRQARGAGQEPEDAVGQALQCAEDQRHAPGQRRRQVDQRDQRDPDPPDGEDQKQNPYRSRRKTPPGVVRCNAIPRGRGRPTRAAAGRRPASRASRGSRRGAARPVRGAITTGGPEGRPIRGGACPRVSLWSCLFLPGRIGGSQAVGGLSRPTFRTSRCDFSEFIALRVMSLRNIAELPG